MAIVGNRGRVNGEFGNVFYFVERKYNFKL
jgi:hypothetical protein